MILILLIFPIVSADWLDDGTCQVNTDCLLTINVVNDTTNYGISTANCTLSVYDINNTLILNETMYNLTEGFYNYTLNMDQSGKYPTLIRCDYLNDSDKADFTFVVSDPNYNEWLYILLFIIPITLYGLGKKEDELAYIVFSGSIFIGFGISIYMRYFPRLEVNFLTESLSVISIGVGIYLLGFSSIRYVQYLNSRR